jgi:DNA-binding transcriptional MerR regulator
MTRKDHTYSTSEICAMFNISKSTLFRWEKEGLLPVVSRDISGKRQYSHEHISAISERQKRRLGKQFAHAIEAGSEGNIIKISEALAIRKFLEGDITGIYELAELPEISTETLRQLMQIGLDQFQPGDRMFCEIIRVLWIHSRGICDG